MLDIKVIRENPELVREALALKNSDRDVSQILDLDRKRRDLLTNADRLKAERNRVSAEIPIRKKEGKDTSELVLEMRTVGDQIAALDNELRALEETLNEQLSWLPNIPHKTVPRGKDESANVVARSWGEIPKRSFKVQPHWEIGEKLGILDLAGAARISGSGFYVLKGLGAKLQRALITYMLDTHTRDGFLEVNVPHLVTADTMYGTGQLPKLAEDMYRTEAEQLYLIPTAEVPVTNLFKQEILSYDELPKYLVAYTPCFRREAGSAGKDTRGMIRVHQFDKVELVKFVRPEKSYAELESLVAQAEKILQGLNLPYRVSTLSTGDLSFAAAKCYDIELWCAGIEKYLEISSCSNFEDFQARRMKCRFKDEQKQTQFPHTLNGSGVALARLIPAILENYQNEDGSVSIPDVLAPYMGGVTTLR